MNTAVGESKHDSRKIPSNIDAMVRPPIGKSKRKNCSVNIYTRLISMYYNGYLYSTEKNNPPRVMPWMPHK